jgi:hypothetical protein
MNELTPTALKQQFDRLERSNRWWKTLACAAVAILGGVVLLGAMESRDIRAADEIRAKRFILVDREGKRLAMLGVDTKEENPKGPGMIGLGIYHGSDRLVHLGEGVSELWISY